MCPYLELLFLLYLGFRFVQMPKKLNVPAIRYFSLTDSKKQSQASVQSFSKIGNSMLTLVPEPGSESM